jgi:hypothetical protein
MIGRINKTSQIILVVGTILVWAAVFAGHGYLHVQELKGSCCGYEGDPDFLWFAFIIHPGFEYLIFLAVILFFELSILKLLSSTDT